jgi:hypothetical protein
MTIGKASKGLMRIYAQQKKHKAEQLEMRDIYNGKWLNNQGPSAVASS